MPEDGDAPEFRPTTYRPRPAFDFEQVKAIVTRFFKVYETEVNVTGVPGGEVSAFYVQSDPAQFSQKFEDLREAIRSLDPNLMVVLQYRTGEDVILIARKPPVSQRGPTVNVFLFIATLLTTTLAGSFFYSGYEQAEGWLYMFGSDVTYFHPRFLALGFLSFSLPVMLILGIHELGHYFVAKRHKVRTSFPFFIPVPPPLLPIGTFGAFISIREPIPDRKALFDIGASGPIAGFLATIPVVVIGLLLTTAVAQPGPVADEIHATLRAPDGTLWGYGHNNTGAEFRVETKDLGPRNEYRETIRLTNATANLTSGPWILRATPQHLEDPATFTFEVRYAALSNQTPATGFREETPGNYSIKLVDRRIETVNASEVFEFTLPANATSLSASFVWTQPPTGVMHLGTSLLFQGLSWLFPVSDNLLIHPTGFAGWVGLLVTGFNLLPAGQLDGGHVARAVLGNNMRFASYASVVGMILLSYFFSGWFLMAVLILLLGVRHPPPLNDKTLLDSNRKVLAFFVLLVLIVCFIPIPFST